MNYCEHCENTGVVEQDEVEVLCDCPKGREMYEERQERKEARLMAEVDDGIYENK